MAECSESTGIIATNAKLISVVNKVDDNLRSIAGGAGSENGTGGMITKLHAATLCMDKDISMVIANGSESAILYDIVSGSFKGTLFTKGGN